MNKLLYRTVGRYYLGESNQQAQYVFQFREDAPKELRRSFLIEMEKDGDFCGSALEVAYEIERVIESYWINSDKNKIKAVVEYLEQWEETDRFEGLVEERKSLAARLLEIDEELSQFDTQNLQEATK